MHTEQLRRRAARIAGLVALAMAGLGACRSGASRPPELVQQTVPVEPGGDVAALEAPGARAVQVQNADFEDGPEGWLLDGANYDLSIEDGN